MKNLKLEIDYDFCSIDELDDDERKEVLSILNDLSPLLNAEFSFYFAWVHIHYLQM